MKQTVRMGSRDHLYLIEFTITRDNMKRSQRKESNPTRLVTMRYLQKGNAISVPEKLNSRNTMFNHLSPFNDIEILIDGAQTFSRYYHVCDIQTVIYP